MADTLPNFYSDQSPIGAALSNLSRIITNGPTEAQRIAQAEAALKLQQQRLGRGTVGGVFQQFGTPGFDRNAAAQAGIQAGMNPQHLAEYERWMAAGKYGATAPQTAGAFVGAGGAYGSSGAGFRENQAREFAQHQAGLAQSQKQFEDTPVVTTTPDNVPVYTRRADAYGQPSQAVFDANKTFEVERMRSDRAAGAQDAAARRAADAQVAAADRAAAAQRDIAARTNVVVMRDGKRVYAPSNQAAGMEAPASMDDVRAGAAQAALPTMSAPNRDAFIGATPPERTPYSVTTPDGVRPGYATPGGLVDTQTGVPFQNPTGVARVQTDDPKKLDLPQGVLDKIAQSRIATGNAKVALSQLTARLSAPDAGASMGWLGQGAAILNGARAQVSAAAQLANGTPFEAQAAELNQRVSSNPNFVATAQRLAIDHAQLRSLVVDLAYMIAQAQDPGSRATDADINNAMQTLGAHLNDPVAMQQVIKTLGERLDAGQAMRERVITDVYGRAPNPASGAPAAPAAPAQPGVTGAGVKWRLVQ